MQPGTTFNSFMSMFSFIIVSPKKVNSLLYTVTRIFLFISVDARKKLLTPKPRISSHNDKMFADMFFALLVANSLILLRRLDNFFLSLCLVIMPSCRYCCCCCYFCCCCCWQVPPPVIDNLGRVVSDAIFDPYQARSGIAQALGKLSPNLTEEEVIDVKRAAVN